CNRNPVERGAWVRPGPRREHESAFVGSRMWQRQHRMLRGHVVNINEIHVQRARAPAHITNSDRTLLKLMTKFQQPVWTPRSLNNEHLIEEIRLLRSPNGCGFGSR